MAEHANIADANLHEPKGAASATTGTTYVSDGAGSGSWKEISIYGEVYGVVADATTIGTIGTTQKKLECFTVNGPSNGTTPDHTNDQITVPTAGDYKVHFSIGFNTNAVGDAGLYQFYVRVDGAESHIGCRVQMSGTTDTTSVSCHGILTLTANQVVTVYVESDDAGADDITIAESSLSVELLKVS